MGTFKIRYLVAKKQKAHTLYYWQPKKELIQQGFLPRRLAEKTNRLEDAVKEAAVLNDELDRWRKGEVQYGPKEGTISWLINQYQKSQWYKEKAEKTRSGYDYWLKRIDDFAGTYPIATLSRKVCKAYYNGLAESSLSSANATMRVLKLLFTFGIDEGYLHDNPVKSIRLSSVKARHQVWEPEEIEALISYAVEHNRHSIATAIILAHFTGQRQTDVLKMKWKQYKKDFIFVRQQKTGAFLQIPALTELKTWLESMEQDNDKNILISEETKKPYTADNFIKRFGDIKRGCGFDSKQFRDLRRTAAVRLVEAGCTPHEIAAITGHDINTTMQILEVYTPRNSTMASTAMQKLEDHRRKQLEIQVGSEE